MGETNQESKQSKQSQEDYLGYSTYAQTLSARISRALEKDAGDETEMGDDPLVVGIFGEWGAGKSKLLQLMLKIARAQLAEQQKQADPKKPLQLTVPVFFQPWKYEHEPHLHVPFVMHVANALKDALKGHRGIATQLTVKTTEVAQKGAKALSLTHKGVSLLSSVFPSIQKTLASLSMFGLSIDLPDEAGEWLEDVADITSNAPDAAKNLEERQSKKAEKLTKQQIIYSQDGLYFYRINEYLRKITRPGKEKDIKETAQAEGIDKDTRINFVIFIDDLDRCLPEKAVETLELIKTIFNLESFAFVLALDEEVVERGIGHRYKDYTLQGKKPEMPITGFEYLEKIVHLPFRLPALTRSQAMSFVRRYEAELEKEEGLRWFSAPVATKRGNIYEMLMRREQGSAMDLLPLALGSFQHYVPRKLIRMVELMHGIAQISRKPGYRDIERIYGGAIDPRIVLSLVLLQLFQPELYRTMRRQTETFSVLLSAFVPNKDDKTELSRTHVSDADLCQWVLGEGKNLGDLPNESSKLIDHLSGQITKELKNSDEQLRYNAQAVKLPLVAQLLAHRSIQRHTFDPIKLFQLLAADMHSSKHAPASVVLRPYLSLLSQKIQRNPLDAKTNWHSIHWLRPLVNDLVSEIPGVQANILSRHDVPEDAYLSQETSAELAKQLAAWKQNGLNAEGRRRFLQGLYYLAPVIAPQHAPALWDLVKDAVKLPQKRGDKLAEPTLAALWADVRDRLGLDARFDASRPFLCAERYGNNSKEVENEPLPGYIKITKDNISNGSENVRDDNPPDTKNIDKDFYIARHLTTVRQFAEFVKAKGYDDSKWWDSQGSAWRNCQWASETNDEALRQWDDSRTQEQRVQPMWWDEQAAHPTRPVYGINWFEARAYCRWLTAQLKELKPQVNDQEFSVWTQLANQGYEVRLPTELQWERSARAAVGRHADNDLYAWGERGNNPEQLANIDASGIGRASVVGLFAPSELGLMDMNGNLWEWQDNLHADKKPYKAWTRIDRIKAGIKLTASGKAEGDGWLKTEEDLQESALPALRGGSWFNSADGARASIRNWNRPDFWNYGVGFRVVLSLAF